MKFIDLTHRFEDGMPVFPGDPHVRILETRNDYILSRIEAGMHAGTHIDAPRHAGYPGTVETISLERLTGTGFLTSPEGIKSHVPGGIAVVRTGWSSRWGSEDYFINYPFLSMEIADELLDADVKGVCMEGPSVDRHGEMEIHRKLLKNDVWIIENIKNTELLPERFRLFAVPLAAAAEASPARVFAVLE